MTIYGANSTSYFSAPAETLDPTLFQGRALRSQIRDGIVSLLNGFFAKHYRHSEVWSHPWLAGSGVSYQWQANRTPKDLDCLVGIDFVQFRKANPEYVGLSDTEIAAQINEQFHDELQPEADNWNGYELTFFVNPSATDIRNLRPYAAYDLKYDEWTVTPDPNAMPPQNPEWDSIVENDRKMTEQITTRFNTALQSMQEIRSEAGHRNAEVRLAAAYQQGDALYDEIHKNRSQAFSPTGQGYADFHNYRWQAGKRAGTIGKLRNIREYVKENSRAEAQATYGIELPDASTLIRRAATYRIK